MDLEPLTRSIPLQLWLSNLIMNGIEHIPHELFGAAWHTPYGLVIEWKPGGLRSPVLRMELLVLLRHLQGCELGFARREERNYFAFGLTSVDIYEQLVEGDDLRCVRMWPAYKGFVPHCRRHRVWVQYAQ